MSGQDWSILITPAQTEGGPAVYTPDLQGQTPGEALQAGTADIVSWNNRTADTHQPWPLDSSGNKLSEADAKSKGLYLSDPIPPWTPSRPGYVTASVTAKTTIDYTCAYHANEQGSIVVWPQ